MHDYPPLVSGALHLLFRHFSQRQEVLQAFKQVGLSLNIEDGEKKLFNNTNTRLTGAAFSFG